MIKYMNAHLEVKYYFHVNKMVFFMLLYVHLTTCVWYYFNALDKKWSPMAFLKDKQCEEM